MMRVLRECSTNLIVFWEYIYNISTEFFIYFFFLGHGFHKLIVNFFVLSMQHKWIKNPLFHAYKVGFGVWGKSKVE